MDSKKRVELILHKYSEQLIYYSSCVWASQEEHPFWDELLKIL